MRKDNETAFPSTAEVSIIPVMQGSEAFMKMDEGELPEVRKFDTSLD